MLTTAPTPASGPYLAHRERQRRRILNAAQELFDLRGIDRVTVAEIVSAAGIRASTLYEYFSNKDEIVWALVEEMIAQGAAVSPRSSMPSRDRRWVRSQRYWERLVMSSAHHPANVRFMAQFDAMYARDWTVEQLLALEDQIIPGRFEKLGALIQEGIADGSLRADLDPQLTMHSLVNAVIGAQRRLASLGNRVEKEYGQPIDKLFGETLRIILLGLRAT